MILWEMVRQFCNFLCQFFHQTSFEDETRLLDNDLVYLPEDPFKGMHEALCFEQRVMILNFAEAVL